MMLQNTIDSWNFFFKDATGDCIALLSQSMRVNEYMPEAILEKLFRDCFHGTELSYEGYIFETCKKKGLLYRDLPLERMEDCLLVNILSSAVKRCTEDERDLLLDLLGLEDNLAKGPLTKVLLDRAQSMDRFLMPAIILLLFGPYYRRLDFLTWPFRLDRNQLRTIEQAHYHVDISYSDLPPTIFIVLNRKNRFKSEDTVDMCQPSHVHASKETSHSKKVGRPSGIWLTSSYREKYSLEEVEKVLDKKGIWTSITDMTRAVRLSEKAGEDSYLSLSDLKTGSGPLSRSSISPYWVAMRDLYPRLNQAHLNDKWSDLKDVKQTTILSGGRPQQTVFFDRKNVEIIRQTVELLGKKLPNLFPL